jgi:anthranilate synthase/aminodeoxychorismate synthase-like glutamine amidotransferase
MLLLIDNYDSFTFNLAQAFQVLGVSVKVVRHDSLSITECFDLRPSYLVIGPGPGHPGQAGISKELISHFAGHVPILGVCLGHQCLAATYGGNVIRAKLPMHGKLSSIHHDNRGVFTGLPYAFQATRYHSLIVEKRSLPACLEISAEAVHGEIMGLRHRDYPSMEGVQFHPESIMTEAGMMLLTNFIQRQGYTPCDQVNRKIN